MTGKLHIFDSPSAAIKVLLWLFLLHRRPDHERIWSESFYVRNMHGQKASSSAIGNPRPSNLLGCFLRSDGGVPSAGKGLSEHQVRHKWSALGAAGGAFPLRPFLQSEESGRKREGVPHLCPSLQDHTRHQTLSQSWRI